MEIKLFKKLKVEIEPRLFKHDKELITKATVHYNNEYND